MNFIQQTKKIALALAVFLTTGPATAGNQGPSSGPSNGPVINPPSASSFDQNLTNVLAMSSEQRAAAYPGFLNAAASAVKAGDATALADNFNYARAANYSQAQIDIFHDPRFSYDNLSKAGFTQEQLFEIGKRLILSDTRAEAYSQGRLFVSSNIPVPTVYDEELAGFNEQFASDLANGTNPDVLVARYQGVLQNFISAYQDQLKGMQTSDPQYTVIEQKMQAAEVFIKSLPTQPLGNGGSGATTLSPEDITSIKNDQAQYDISIKADAEAIKTAASSIESALNDAVIAYDAKIRAGEDASSIEANYEALKAQAEQFNEDGFDSEIKIPELA